VISVHLRHFGELLDTDSIVNSVGGLLCSFGGFLTVFLIFRAIPILQSPGPSSGISHRIPEQVPGLGDLLRGSEDQEDISRLDLCFTGGVEDVSRYPSPKCNF
jgi:hypothetical protein